MISLSDLITALTTDQVEANILDNLEVVGLKPRSWAVGGALRTIIRVIAGIYAGFTDLAVRFAKSGFLDLSEGGWLTLLAYYVYGVTRIEATFATGTVTLTNTGGGVFTVSAGGLRVLSSVTGKAYTNVSPFVLNPASSLDVAVIAVELGAASSAVPGTVTQFETVLPSVSVTNAAAIVGIDAESDPVLRQRCKDKLGTLSGLGPRSAYAYAVRSATRTDGSRVDINRLSISPSSSTGIVTIYVAAPSGAPISTDVDAVVASVDALAKPDTVTANVFAATALPLTYSLTVWAIQTSGLSATDLANLVSNALLAMVTTYPIGGVPKPPSTQGYLYASRIEGAVTGAHPSIYAVDGVGADVAMSPGQVATLATTVTVRLTVEEAVAA